MIIPNVEVDASTKESTSWILGYYLCMFPDILIVNVENKERLLDISQIFEEHIFHANFLSFVIHGRRWSDGLHQAVEAKEGLPIQNETVTLASISYQNFFLQVGVFYH